jgi:hypothetical protein
MRSQDVIESNGARGVNEPLQQLIHTILADKPIAYYAVLARALNSATAGILLSQFLYWTPRARDGWFYKTRDEIYRETALTRREQETARAVLRKTKLIDEQRRGVPARMYYRVNMEQLVKLLTSYRPDDIPNNSAPEAEMAPPFGQVDSYQQEGRDSSNKKGGKRPTGRDESAQLVGALRTNKSAQKAPTITENTQQTTTESTSSNITTENTRDDDAIADALRRVGVSPRQAKRLATTYAPELVLDKIDLVEYLKSVHDRRVSINPQGFLIRAIEEAYSAPEGYKSKAVREQESKQHQQLDEEIEQAREERRRAYGEMLAKKPAKKIAGTKLTTKTAWDQTLVHLSQAMSGPNFRAWFTHTILLECDRRGLVIGAPSQFHIDWIQSRLSPLLRKTLTQVLGQDITDAAIDYMVIKLPSSEGDIISNSPNGNRTRGRNVPNSAPSP